MSLYNYHSSASVHTEMVNSRDSYLEKMPKAVIRIDLNQIQSAFASLSLLTWLVVSLFHFFLFFLSWKNTNNIKFITYTIYKCTVQ